MAYPDDVPRVAEGAEVRSAFSLHVSTACAAPLRVQVRVSRPAVWQLPFSSASTVYATEVTRDYPLTDARR